MYWATVRLNSTLKIKKKKNQTSTTFKQTAPHSKADKVKAQFWLTLQEVWGPVPAPSATYHFQGAMYCFQGIKSYSATPQSYIKLQL